MTFPDEDDRRLRSAELRWLRAALRGDDAERERISREEAPGGPPIAMTFAACVVAARRIFDERWDLRVITVFAQRIVERMPVAGTVFPRHIETLLRCALGDLILLTEAFPVMVAEAPETLRVALFAMVDELVLDDDAIDALIVETAAEVAKAEELALMEPYTGDGDPLPDGGTWRRTHQRYLIDGDFLPRRHAAARRPLVFIPEQPKGWRKGIAVPVSKAGLYLRSLTRRKLSGDSRVEQIPNADLLRVARTAFPIAATKYIPPDPDISDFAALARAARKSFGPEPDLMKAEYLARTALQEKVPLDGITSADVYLSCMSMLTIIFDWWDNDDAASYIMARAEELVEKKGHTLAK
jgi:hypothetical protein